MSNPYDPNAGKDNPYGGSDSSGGYGQGAGGYGQGAGGYGQGAGGYGQGGDGGYGGGYGSPYGQPNPYDQTPKKTDAVSITGFVLSLTCCLSLIGAILGFIGLSRTKGGQRKGRWAAIAASIIGVLGTLVAAGGIVFVVVLARGAIGPDNAEVGQCANVSRTDGDNISLQEKDCDSGHDAEIVAVDTFGNLDPELVPESIDDLTDSAISEAGCRSLMDTADADKIGDDYDWTLALEDPANPSDSDKVICFVERGDGEKIDAPLL